MPANIKNNNILRYDLHLLNDKYYDYMLYKGECEGDGQSDRCKIADFDFNDSNIDLKENIKSSIVWDDARNGGVVMNNIGLTGVDNGYIKFRKDMVSNEEFLEIYTNSEKKIPSDEKEFFMIPVTGNTMDYIYPVEVNEDGSLAFKGGFLQGFYKLYGFDYQTLPDKVSSDWDLSFRIRKRDYEVLDKTLNKEHPDNSDIFFYMGTRAENKFMFNYNGLDKEPEGSGNLTIIDNRTAEFVMDEDNSIKLIDGGNVIINVNGVEMSGIIKFDEDSKKYIISDFKKVGNVGSKFEGVKISKKTITDFNMYTHSDGFDGYNDFDETTLDEGYFVDGEYMYHDINLEDVDITTSEGHDLNKRGYYDITTDNKFIFFDHTKDGFTTETWDENNEVHLSGRNVDPNVNLFEVMNNTPTGYTTETIGKYLEEKQKKYDEYKDLYGNSFALQLKESDDGYDIGYRYGILDCGVEDESHYNVVEEYSEMKPEFKIKKDEWADIDVRISILNGAGIDECDPMNGKRKMKLYFYVNGNLVLVSKELPEFRFRQLDEISQKQEAVPYNISLGGGSQGLADMVWKNYYLKTDIRLPIENNFGGTFLGDISKFSFHDCSLNYNEIKVKNNRL